MGALRGLLRGIVRGIRKGHKHVNTRKTISYHHGLILSIRFAFESQDSLAGLLLVLPA